VADGPKDSVRTGADLWRRAASFAARAHRHHTRRDGETPYFSHPVRVALSLSVVFGCDDPEAIAIALLHDTIEDTTTDYEDLADAFGTVVADGVAALTKDAALPESERESHAEARLRAGDWRATLVRLGDQLDNLRDADPRDPDPARRARLVARVRWALAVAADTEERRDLIGHAAGIVESALRDFESRA
jgi:(p)ppGpp synthase/HD superfamily hydrolase